MRREDWVSKFDSDNLFNLPQFKRDEVNYNSTIESYLGDELSMYIKVHSYKEIAAVSESLTLSGLPWGYFHGATHINYPVYLTIVRNNNNSNGVIGHSYSFGWSSIYDAGFAEAKYTKLKFTHEEIINSIQSITNKLRKEIKYQ